MYRVELKALSNIISHLWQMSMFLMYRVELKAFPLACFLLRAKVPNVPCGVERHLWRNSSCQKGRFLMYRVELKEVIWHS